MPKETVFDAAIHVESIVKAKVSYETRFIWKQPKLEPKLVSTLSETKRLVSVVSRNSETASFG